MKMRSSNYIKGYLTSVCALIVAPLLAQETQSQTQEQARTTTDSISVIRDYRPMLADAVKIRRSPDMTNKREYQPKLTYRVIDKKLDITTGTKQLNIQEMRFDVAEDRRNNYVKIGAGNYGTLLGEVYVSNDDYQDTRFGGYVKHLNQKGSMLQQKYSQQEIGVFGRQLYEPFTISGEIGYKRNGTYFFGQPLDTLGLSLNPDPAKQTFHDIFLNAELTSNKGHEVDAWSYSLKADGYLYNNSFEAKENSLALGGYVNKAFNQFNLGAHVSTDFTTVQDLAYKQGNHIARIEPYLKFQGPQYHLQIGARLVAEFGSTSRVNLFPSVSAEFALIPEYAYVFGGVEGDVRKTSYRELTRQNPWLAQNINIQNSLNKLNVYGGIKGNAGATFGYKLKAFYKQIESLPLFMNDPFTPYQYIVQYESVNDKSTVFGLEGEMNLRVSETVALGGTLLFNEYTLNTYEQAWYMPKLRLTANTRVNISDKLYLDGEILVHGITYTQLPALFNTASTQGTGQRTSIPAFADLSAGLEYRATKQLGIYVRANNLLGKEYERFAFYPRLGLNVIGGVNFSF
jgi:hypothetical protein